MFLALAVTTTMPKTVFDDLFYGRQIGGTSEADWLQWLTGYKSRNGTMNGFAAWWNGGSTNYTIVVNNILRLFTEAGLPAPDAGTITKYFAVNMDSGYAGLVAAVQAEKDRFDYEAAIAAQAAQAAADAQAAQAAADAQAAQAAADAQIIPIIGSESSGGEAGSSPVTIEQEPAALIVESNGSIPAASTSGTFSVQTVESQPPSPAASIVIDPEVVPPAVPAANRPAAPATKTVTYAALGIGLYLIYKAFAGRGRTY